VRKEGVRDRDRERESEKDKPQIYFTYMINNRLALKYVKNAYE
jgi:hypothetical protein